MKKILLMVCVTLFFGILLTPPAVSAAGDAELQLMRSDIEACMQQGLAGEEARIAFSKKYNVPLGKVEELCSGSSSGKVGSQKWQIICGIENSTGVGTAIWAARADMDQYTYSFGALRPADYCCSYSEYCDHYNWQQGCLKRSWPACCK